MISATLLTAALLAAPASAPAPIAHQALLEVHLVEMEPAGRMPTRDLHGVYDLPAQDLGRALNRLPEEAASASHPPETETGALYPVPGMGLAKSGRVLTAPRLITSDGSPARIDVEVQTVAATERDTEDASAGNPGPTAKTVDADFSLDAEWSWERESPGEAHLWLHFELVQEEAVVQWDGEMALHSGETGVVTLPRRGRLYGLAVTFRPLEPDEPEQTDPPSRP